MEFTEVARARGDHAFVQHCQREAEGLRQNIDQNGWDGKWYRRAYFDDGSPLGSASNPECQVEPYVVAADVYAVPPHTGRGGWTWYTGSAAWMYRLIVESLLGLWREVDKLRLTPCLPADWEGFTLHYRYRETVCHIEVLQTPAENGEMRVSVDGIEQPDKTLPLVDDHKEHWVEMRIPGGRQPHRHAL